MKYLKTYEANKTNNFLVISLTKNSIFDFDEQYKYYIVKVVDDMYYDERLLVNFLFGYSDENNYETMNLKEYIVLYDEINVIFESKLLYACKDHLKTMSVAKKYNI